MTNDNDDNAVISANIISIGDFVLKRALKKPYDSCRHIHTTFDDEQHQVQCVDCSQILDNYFALKMFIAKWDRLQSRIDRQQKVATEAMNKTVVLRAAQKVESAWRSRNMVPTCPQCHEAIFATDNFGDSSTNKEMALRRREIKNANKTKT